jgi:hypothetical protein
MGASCRAQNQGTTDITVHLARFLPAQALALQVQAGDVVGVLLSLLPPDADGDGLHDGVDPDDDNDAMSDVYELRYRLNPFSAAVIDLINQMLSD